MLRACAVVGSHRNRHSRIPSPAYSHRMGSNDALYAGKHGGGQFSGPHHDAYQLVYADRWHENHATFCPQSRLIFGEEDAVLHTCRACLDRPGDGVSSKSVHHDSNAALRGQPHGIRQFSGGELRLIRRLIRTDTRRGSYLYPIGTSIQNPFNGALQTAGLIRSAPAEYP